MNHLNYFNPIFHRKEQIELNGKWDFSFDKQVWQDIQVPFCPESKLSGIAHTDFIPKCFYKKKIIINKNDLHPILHFGAVDYECTVFCNGREVGYHKGGYTPFEVDLYDAAIDGENLIELSVIDDNYLHQPTGKQCHKRESAGCLYTRTTGIWQPVWLEYVPENHIQDIKYFPHIQNNTLEIQLGVYGEGDYSIEVSYKGQSIAKARGFINGNTTCRVNMDNPLYWEIGNGNLYDVEVTFGEDTIYSYFGYRETAYKGMEYTINNKHAYQKLVLDQGFNMDGIYTEPSVDFMREQIKLTLDLGFNGIRLHQKVFDPRFLYLCDEMGVICWGEFPSWGVDYRTLDSYAQFEKEWGEVLKRDFNHPCIITWCPLNEVWLSWVDGETPRDIRYIDKLYDFTKSQDPTRPVVDTSGGYHGNRTDLYDYHCYEPLDVVERSIRELDEEDKIEVNLLYSKEEPDNHYQKGIPVNLSEFGGISLNLKEGKSNWGYGKGARDGDDFVNRYGELLKAISKSKKLSGFCYTQLYDVEQEQNGFYYYDRTDKLTKEQKDKIKEYNNLCK